MNIDTFLKTVSEYKPREDFPTLYGKSEYGTILIWRCEINPENPSQYRTISGTKDGKHTKSAWKSAEGKNTGKKNQRTAEEQAIAEVESMYTKRLKADYFKSEADVDQQRFIHPMLAETYDKKKNQFDFRHDKVFVQKKYDGIRCIISKKGMFSRNGEEIVSCPHIMLELEEFLNKGMIFDGELYNHEYKDDFNTIVSCVKKKKPTREQLEFCEETVEYYIYDVPSILRGGFEYRYASLEVTLSPIQFKYIRLANTKRVYSQLSLDQHFDDCMAEGYEGQMIRIDFGVDLTTSLTVKYHDNSYQNRRSKTLLKHKEWAESEFELIGFEEGKGNWAGKAKKGLFKIPDDWTVQEGEDRTFKAGIKGNMAYAEKLLKDKEKYVGTFCTVKYAPQLTPAGKPRFGVVKEFDRTDNLDINEIKV